MATRRPGPPLANSAGAMLRAEPAVALVALLGPAGAMLRAVPAMAVVALFGPTGVGKTAVAIALAERLRARGERPVAVSADALQLYRGLEILTGAPSAAERARLEHRLVGVLPPTETASAGAYARMAHVEIDALLADGRRPIVVGGTGLYLRAALADLDLRPPPAAGARERWTDRLAREGAPALHAQLAARDRATAAGIAPGDGQRVVRALELLDAGAPPPPAEAEQLWTAETRHPTLLVALTMDREALYARIDARVDAMVAAGAAEEVRRAAAAGASPGARQALGFEELLRGDVEAMRTRTRRYAKRQLTWLRKLPGALQLDLTARDPDDAAAIITRRLEP
jgi:tRNA dimethylallyltransferase